MEGTLIMPKNKPRNMGEFLATHSAAIKQVWLLKRLHTWLVSACWLLLAVAIYFKLSGTYGFLVVPISLSGSVCGGIAWWLSKKQSTVVAEIKEMNRSMRNLMATIDEIKSQK